MDFPLDGLSRCRHFSLKSGLRPLNAKLSCCAARFFALRGRSPVLSSNPLRLTKFTGEASIPLISAAQEHDVGQLAKCGGEIYRGSSIA